MVPRREKEFFKQLLGGEDRIANRIVLDGPSVLEFSVQLEFFYNEGWVAISRIDSCDGGTHRHTFHAGDDGDVRVTFFSNNLNEGLTYAQEYFTENYKSLRENYLTQAHKRKDN